MSGDLAPRRYTEKEAGKILRRAAELQRAEPSVADPSGFSLSELEEVAQEAGIDPAVVRRAAAELQDPAGTPIAAALAGGPIRILLETEVPGEYPADRLGELVPLIQDGSTLPGQAGAVGRSLTWTARSESNTSALQVFVSAGDGRTRIRIEERLGGMVAGLFGGVVGGAGAGIGVGVGVGAGAAIGSAVMMVAFPLLAIGGSYALARAWYAAHTRRETGRLQLLLDRLAAHAGSVIAAQSLPPVDSPEQPV